MNAPSSATPPPIAQASRISDGCASTRATFDGFAKIPTPMMPPATTTAASTSPSSRRKPPPRSVIAARLYRVGGRHAAHQRSECVAPKSHPERRPAGARPVAQALGAGRRSGESAAHGRNCDVRWEAIIHELIARGLYDREFLVRYSNAGQLVNQDEAGDEFGLMMRNPEGDVVNPLRPHNCWWWDRVTGRPVADHTEGADPALFGSFAMPDGTPVKPAFQLLQERVSECTPEWAAEITGIDAATIRRLAHEMGMTARDQTIELPIAWTDWWGQEHKSVTGNPVAFHAMRGLAAHSNGFQTIRALAILMSLLGTIDRPGGFRHKAPFPRGIPPLAKTPKGPEGVRPDTPLAGLALGWPGNPDDLFVDADNKPVRIDKAFSWEYPLSVHGLMHNVITNAWRGDPYRIDTLMIFMANMAWTSSMNTSAVREMLNRKDEKGEYMIPFLVVCDTFQSETVAFADLVLPDTTYLERHDVMSMLDRPISEFDGPVDSIRVPVVPPPRGCKPFQEVLVELASRLKLPAFTTPDGDRKFSGYQDFIVNFE